MTDNVINREKSTSNILYYGDGGDDSNDGKTWETRFETFEAMEKIVAPGDIVYSYPNLLQELIKNP